jgi:hypothetical protein
MSQLYKAKFDDLAKVVSCSAVFGFKRHLCCLATIEIKDFYIVSVCDVTLYTKDKFPKILSTCIC